MTKDDSIVIDKDMSSEGYIQSTNAKKVIFDIPAHLMDKRRTDTEIQVSAQDFILKRGEIYASDLLLIQYSADKGQLKGDVNYNDVQGVILVVLMKNSPAVFKKDISNHYIHRFNKAVADSGFSYTPLVTTVYVQLDKCFDQFKKNIDGENNSQLQILLSAMYDINDVDIQAKAQNHKIVFETLNEVKSLA